MSTAMTLLGYGALPNGRDLIAREQQREAGQDAPKHHLLYPDFPFSVQRDFSDDAVEILIEITHYRPSGNNRGLDHRDPAYDSGEVEFGEAHYLDGKKCALTPVEREAAEEAFWNQ